MIKEVKPRSYPVSKDLKLDFEALRKAAIVLRAINHKVRQKILLLIHKKGEITVSEIYYKLRLEQSVTSSHLAILRKANMVRTKRIGQNIFYTVDYDHLLQVEDGAKLIIR
jgi:DNA-binding transcriptional ArsR family regulator